MDEPPARLEYATPRSLSMWESKLLCEQIDGGVRLSITMPDLKRARYSRRLAGYIYWVALIFILPAVNIVIRRGQVLGSGDVFWLIVSIGLIGALYFRHRSLTAKRRIVQIRPNLITIIPSDGWFVRCKELDPQKITRFYVKRWRLKSSPQTLYASLRAHTARRKYLLLSGLSEDELGVVLTQLQRVTGLQIDLRKFGFASIATTDQSEMN